MDKDTVPDPKEAVNPDGVAEDVAPNVDAKDVPGVPANGRTIEDVATLVEGLAQKLDAVIDNLTPQVVDDAAEAGTQQVVPDDRPTGVPWTHRKFWR